MDKDGYFGEEMLTIDMDTLHGKGEPVLAATYSAKALEDCTLGVLTIKDARKLVDTTSLGISKEAKAPKKKVQVKDLEKHKILGAGTFGQVWLVSEKEKDKSKAEVYALKIQSKYDLIQNNQAKGVVNEKNIMAKLDHPFILKLIATDQDPQRVYMVTSLVQGGELYSVLHTPNRDGVSEKEAKFYAAGVIEGLTYMHNKVSWTCMCIVVFILGPFSPLNGRFALITSSTVSCVLLLFRHCNASIGIYSLILAWWLNSNLPRSQA